MADVKWIKIAVNIFDNEKIQLIENMPGGDTAVVIWFKLLTLAGKQNNRGVFTIGGEPYTLSMFSTVFGRSVPVIERAFARLERFGMIENNDGVISIPSWSDHQNVERLSELKGKKRAKKQKSDTDKEKDKDKETDFYNSGFSPPTLEKIMAYCSEKNFKVDPIRFFTYYTACGWKIGQKNICNWKAVVDMWESQGANNGASFDLSQMNEEIFFN